MPKLLSVIALAAVVLVTGAGASFAYVGEGIQGRPQSAYVASHGVYRLRRTPTHRTTRRVHSHR